MEVTFLAGTRLHDIPGLLKPRTDSPWPTRAMWIRSRSPGR
jgi:hypothetical protein